MSSDKPKLSSKSFAVKGSDRSNGYDKGKLSSQSFSAKNAAERIYVPKRGVVRKFLFVCIYKGLKIIMIS